MWHIYRNKHKLFEFAFISKGRYIVGSKQGYVNHKSCVNAIMTIGALEYQDDTKDESKYLPTIFLYSKEPGEPAKYIPSTLTPHEPYKP